MAIIKLGSMVTDIRNKVGGHTYSKSRGVATVRSNASGIVRSSASAVLFRGNWQYVAQQWRALTQAQQNSWNAATADWLRTDMFGDVRSMSGFNLFMRLNVYYNYEIGGVQLVPPSPVALPLYYGAALVVSRSTSTISYSAGSAGTIGNSVAMFALSRSVSAGVSYPPSSFYVVGNDGITASSINYYARYIARYSAPLVGRRVFGTLQLVNRTTGQLGAKLIASAIVT